MVLNTSGHMRVGQSYHVRPPWEQSDVVITSPIPAKNVRFWTIIVSNTFTTNPLIKQNDKRLSLLLSNVSAGVIYVGQQPNVSIAGGDTFPIGAGQSLSFDSYYGPIYAIAAAPNSSIGIIELFE